MRILILGLGNIGKTLAERLRSEGHRVVGTTTTPEKVEGLEPLVDALHKFGAKTISVITPYPSIGDDNVVRFFNDIGFEVKAIKGLARPSATAIAETTIPMVMDAIREIDGDDVDAIIQCGTNLSTVDIFPTMEHWLQKPLIPINIACIWHALRASGIDDKIIGKGRLLEEF